MGCRVYGLQNLVFDFGLTLCGLWVGFVIFGYCLYDRLDLCVCFDFVEFNAVVVFILVCYSA